jgi:hypothetical protein
MSIVIKSGDSSDEVNVDENNALFVNLPSDIETSGYIVSTIEADSGSIMGSKTIRPLLLSQDYRTVRNFEDIIWQDKFNYPVLNNNKYIVTTTNQTVTVDTKLNLNAGNSVTSGDYSLVKTFRTFSLYGANPTYVNIEASFSTTLQSNSLIEFGLGIVLTAATITDGIFFRASGGTLYGVVNQGGYEMYSVNIHTPVANTVYDYLLGINMNSVEFWVNNVMVSRITPETFTGTTSLSNSLHLFLRNRNTGTVPSAIQLNVSQASVLFADCRDGRNWATTMIGNGWNSISAPDGQAVQANTSGTTTANIANSVAPNLVTLDNTNPGYAELGGQFFFSAYTGSEVDNILFAYLNPAGTATIGGRNLFIQGVSIDTFSSGATIGANSNLFQWYIGVGGTSVDLSTQDDLTSGTRASRKLGLGYQTMSATSIVGSMAQPRIAYEFISPLLVEPGTYCHIILKMPVADATANLVYRGLVMINGYFD